MIKVGIIGASGYAGAELMRIVAGHPGAEIAFVTANQYMGSCVSDLYPNLTGIVELEYVEFEPEQVSGADIVFVGLPHGASMEIVPQLVSRNVKIIDLSGDFRLSDAEVYESWYGLRHIAPEIIGRAVYGLTELYREEVSKASFVSNPGCYPTGSALALAPVVKEGLIDLDSILIDAKSGASGAGRSAKLETHYCTIDENFTAYKVGGKHQHTPEIERVLGDMAGRDLVVGFTPHLIPMSRGILTTAYAGLKGSATVESLVELYRRFYEGCTFVKILDGGKMPQTKAVSGSNYCHIGIAVDARTKRVVIVSAIDNLVKGAAGQAVQNMNLMFGLEEEVGLTAAGLYP
ncbi:MAG: N-acetyl-gamma-glutamyl-phosphate reductase [Chloroflexi bacterium]|nr:N-acetyl-gamma-glutamyl-phosphate reductase [Chloroflexota bacterium]